MALLFIDSCDHYQTAQLGTKWTNIVSPSAVSIATGFGRCNTNAIKFISGSGTILEKGIAFGSTTTVMGVAVHVVEQTVEHSRLLSFGSGGGSGMNVYITRTTDGALHAFRDEAAPVLLGSSAPDVVRVGSFYFVEFKLLTDAAAGAVTLRVNGSAVLTLAGIDTLSSVAGSVAAATSIRLMGFANLIWYADDIYALDTTGAGPTNDFLGDTRVEYLRPDGAGANQAWDLVGAATHWQAVDDNATPDDDTSYIHTATVGLVDTETYLPTGLPSGTIFGLQANLYARKTDSGLREIAPVIRHAGVDFVGVNVQPSFGSYLYLMQLYALNPGTGVAWTIADINAMEVGVKLTT